MHNERVTMMTTMAYMRSTGRHVRRALVACSLAMATGCSIDGILKSDELPPDVTDPAITKTPAGAVAAYHGLVEEFRGAFGGEVFGRSVTAIGGMLGDELQLGSSSLGRDAVPVDARAMIEGVADADALGVYGKLQKARGQASQAIGLLTRYAPDQRAVTGHAYVLQAFSEIFLAELFCSGIPLSTLDYEGDYTLRPGSTTEEVYQHALALLDTALLLVTDSTRFVDLTRMAQARALLGLGDFAGAAAAAAAVPDGFSYSMPFLGGSSSTSRNFAFISLSLWSLSVADLEGVNGLNYRTSADPRVTTTRTATNQNGFGIFHPNKYLADGSSPIVLASAVEARLIEAEAALAAGNGAWLAAVNALRTNGTFTTRPNATNPAVTDTLWNAGSGGVAQLAPLADPGTPEARVDLLFRERAFWLFLTGHRHADLRRLVRHYGRNDFSVYPSGAYPALGGQSYGNDVTIPIPPEERVSNPHFSGCISRDA